MQRNAGTWGACTPPRAALSAPAPRPAPLHPARLHLPSYVTPLRCHQSNRPTGLLQLSLLAECHDHDAAMRGYVGTCHATVYHAKDAEIIAAVLASPGGFDAVQQAVITALHDDDWLSLELEPARRQRPEDSRAQCALAHFLVQWLYFRQRRSGRQQHMRSEQNSCQQSGSSSDSINSVPSPCSASTPRDPARPTSR